VNGRSQCVTGIWWTRHSQVIFGLDLTILLPLLGSFHGPMILSKTSAQFKKSTAYNLA